MFLQITFHIYHARGVKIYYIVLYDFYISCILYYAYIFYMTITDHTNSFAMAWNLIQGPFLLLSAANLLNVHEKSAQASRPANLTINFCFPLVSNLTIDFLSIFVQGEPQESCTAIEVSASCRTLCDSQASARRNVCPLPPVLGYDVECCCSGSRTPFASP